MENDGTSFTELAQQYSEDKGSKSNGGDLGWSTGENYDPDSGSLKTLTEGQISEPVRSMYGYTSFSWLVQHEPKPKINYQKAQNIIFHRKFTDALQLWREEIRQSAYIKYLLPIHKI